MFVQTIFICFFVSVSCQNYQGSFYRRQNPYGTTGFINNGIERPQYLQYQPQQKFPTSLEMPTQNVVLEEQAKSQCQQHLNSLITELHDTIKRRETIENETLLLEQEIINEQTETAKQQQLLSSMMSLLANKQ